VEDPDGTSVGIMSPIDESKRRPPPFSAAHLTIDEIIDLRYQDRCRV